MPITGPDSGCMAASTGWRGEALVTPDLVLRLPTEDDIPALVDLAGDWEVAKFTSMIPHPYGEDDARAFLDEAAGGRAAGTHIVFAVERRATPGLIGCAGLRIKDGAAELGYWIGTPHGGRGYATQAAQALMRLAFTKLGLSRAFAEIMAGNPASGRVLAKAGLAAKGAATGCRGRCAGQPTEMFEITREAWAAREVAKPQVLVAAVALVDTDGRVLLAKRPVGKSMAGLWEFPGGKLDPGETPEAALVRELAEELAIDITESCLAPLAFASHPYEDFHLLMPLYVCRTWLGQVTPLEGQTLKWVRPLDMRDIPMPPADLPLIPLLRDTIA